MCLMSFGICFHVCFLGIANASFSSFTRVIANHQHVWVFEVSLII
jgi:hypothetical protein